MTTYFVCSDIHTEFLHPVEQWELFKQFPKADGIIIAGDLSTKKYLVANIKYLCDSYEHVIFTTGNHEYYSSSFSEIDSLLLKIKESNFHWLNDSACVINDTTFVGGTLWFPDNPLNQLYEKRLNDFFYIKDFRKEVYKKNEKTIMAFNKLMVKDSIVITHHLPSYQSVDEKYKGDQLNRFFVCDMEDLMLKKQPKLWVHGHTHDSLSYGIKNTKVLCNPLGYSTESSGFYCNLIIEL